MKEDVLIPVFTLLYLACWRNNLCYGVGVLGNMDTLKLDFQWLKRIWGGYTN